VGAGRVSFAEVAFDNFLVDFIYQRASEGTGRHAGHAFNATPLVKFDGAGFFIPLQGIKNAGLDASGIIALQAGHRNIFIFRVSQRINSASPRLQIFRMTESTGQFACATSSAKGRINNKPIFHPVISCA